MATATVSYVAELKDLRTQLASIPDLTKTEAQKAVSELNKAMRAVESEMKRARKPLETTAKGFKGLGLAARSTAQQIPDVISQLSAGTPALQVFTQQGLQVAQVNMGLLGAASGTLVPALAAVTGAVGLGYAAWRIYTFEQRQAEAAARSLAIVQGAVTAAISRVEDAQTAAAIATGKITAEQAAYEAGVKRARKATDDQIDTALKELGVNRRGIEVTMQAIEASNDKERVIANLSDEQRKAISLITQVNAAYTIEVQALDQTREAMERKRKASKKHHAETKKELTDEQMYRAFLYQEEARLDEETRKARESSINSEIEQERAYTAFVIAEADKRYEEKKRLAEEAALAEAEAQRVLVSELQGLMGTYSSFLANDAQQRADTNKQAAQREWNVSQGLAYSEAFVNTLAGMTRALTDYPYPASVAIALAVEAQGLGQVMAIASQQPSFDDTPGVIKAGNKGLTANFAANDYVIAAQDLSSMFGTFGTEGSPLHAVIDDVNEKTLDYLLYGIRDLMLLSQIAPFGLGLLAYSDTPKVMRAGSSGALASFAPGDMYLAGRNESDLVRQMQRAGIGAGGTEVLIRDADQHRGRYGRNPMAPPDRYTPLRRRAGRIPGRV